MQTSAKQILKNKEFQADKVQEWLSSIFEDILRRLSQLGPRFKYCATGVITQNCGAGLHIANCNRLEKNVDNFACYKYQENSILCLLVVYGYRI
ncbi:Dynein light chain Tctex-type, variant 2 [Tritrichomonas musculus]